MFQLLLKYAAEDESKSSNQANCSWCRMQTKPRLEFWMITVKLEKSLGWTSLELHMV